MKRVMIIGCCGAGKSTLSHKLQAITGLPLYHLDQLYWRSGWVETPKEEWEPIVKDLTLANAWIIDGNYSSTMDIRLSRADTVLFLDYPTYKCLYRVLGRIRKYRGRERPDMPEGCKERYDLDFLHYVATFNFHSRKRIIRKLKKVESDTKIITLHNDREVQRFLASMEKNHAS